eukprot:XP_019929019.1 PREDICTED: baculoviral IAP repeat-containing protein 7-B [Crassostrea gigas]
MEVENEDSKDNDDESNNYDNKIETISNGKNDDSIEESTNKLGKQGLIDSHSEIFRFVGIRGTNDIQACPTTQQQVLEPFLNRLSAPDNKPSKHDTMAMEFLRLYSMHDYPSKQGPSLLRLAEAGFYYEGNGNELTCFSCGVCNRNWSYGDSPKEIHQRLSPGCKFLTEEGGDGNVPVPRNQPTEGPSELATSHSGIRTFDRPNTEDGASAMEPVHNTAKSPSASCKQPMSESLPQFKHPKYASDSARLASFQSFPLRRTQSPALLASAGFFYAGYGDCCKCFSCGIGLGKWEPEDNPWVEHARWSQECPFILQMKGQAFIDLVQEAVRKADMTNSHLNDENDSSDKRSHNNSTNKQVENIAMLEAEISRGSSENGEISSGLRNQELTIVKLKGELKRTWKELKRHLRILGETSEREVECRIKLQRTTSQNRKIIEYQDELIKKLKNELDEKNQMMTRQSDSLICKICLDKHIEVLFMPCRHLISCHDCARRLQRRCPVCRNEIHNTIFVILG